MSTDPRTIAIATKLAQRAVTAEKKLAEAKKLSSQKISNGGSKTSACLAKSYELGEALLQRSRKERTSRLKAERKCKIAVDLAEGLRGRLLVKKDKAIVKEDKKESKKVVTEQVSQKKTVKKVHDPAGTKRKKVQVEAAPAPKNLMQLVAEKVDKPCTSE